MKILTKIKDPSVVEPTCWACFRYGAQACRLSFPSSYVPSGTLVRDFMLVALSYLFRACVISPGGFLVVGRDWFPPSFDCHSPLLPPSFDCDFRFPPSFVPGFLLLLSSGPGSRYGGLAEISSGEWLVLFSKSRCNGSSHLLPVRAGHKACFRSFLWWWDSCFPCCFRDNPRQDWHDGSTVSPWP